MTEPRPNHNAGPGKLEGLPSLRRRPSLADVAVDAAVDCAITVVRALADFLPTALEGMKTSSPPPTNHVTVVAPTQGCESPKEDADGR